MADVGGEVIFTTPTRYTVDDYRRDIALPNPSLKARYVDLAVNAACLIHKNTPAAWLADQIGNDGKISPEHILLDDLCRPRNQVPPDPAPPFSGGQCDAVGYEVRVNYSQSYVSNGEQRTRSSQSTGSFWGAIESVSLSDPISPVVQGVTLSGSSKASIVCRGGYFGQLGAKHVEKLDVSQGGESPALSITSVQMTRLGSGTDNCGNPAPRYPPTLPSPGDLVTTSPFQITPTLTVPITVTVTPTIKFDPTVYSPVILVNVGGTNVNIDLGGFTLAPDFSNNTNNTFPQTNPITPPGSAVTVKNPSKHVADDIDILEIINRLDRIGRELEECCERDRPYPPPDATKVITTVLGTGSSGGYDLPDNTFQIALRITTIPLKGKQQDGYDAPDVLYAGWAWFGAANNLSERMPVDSQFKLYSPPRYISNSFYFTLYDGMSATITAYSIKPKPNPP